VKYRDGTVLRGRVGLYEHDGHAEIEVANARRKMRRALKVPAVVGGVAIVGVLGWTQLPSSSAQPSPSNAVNAAPTTIAAAAANDKGRPPAGSLDKSPPPFAVPPGFKVIHTPLRDGGKTKVESWLVYQPGEFPSTLGPSFTVTVVAGDEAPAVRDQLRSEREADQVAGANKVAAGSYRIRRIGSRAVATTRHVAGAEQQPGRFHRDVDLHLFGAKDAPAVVQVISEGVDDKTVDSVIASSQV
jgi:hypothetical protein